MGVVKGIPAQQVSQLVNTSSVDLLLSDLLSTQQGRHIGLSCLLVPINRFSHGFSPFAPIVLLCNYVFLLIPV